MYYVSTKKENQVETCIILSDEIKRFQMKHAFNSQQNSNGLISSKLDELYKEITDL